MFANNHQITHRQLFRQIALAFVGIFLLCIPGWELLEGRRGLICLGIGTLFLLFYIIFLVRLSTAFGHMEKTFGKIEGKIIVLLYCSYLFVTGVFLVVEMQRVVSRFLIPGTAPWFIIGIGIIFCYLGSRQGLERRGRMAEVCFPLIIGALVLMFFLAIFQVEPAYLQESVPVSAAGLAEGSYGIFCAFAPLLLLPFTLGRVVKPGSARKVIIGVIALMAGILSIAFILLQGTFGKKGFSFHVFPMAELMTGVELPGAFLERVDVFWIIIIIFSIMFALGSVFFYGHEILGRVGWEKGQPALGVLVFFGGAYVAEGNIDLSYYGLLLEWVFIPLLLILSIYAGFRHKRRR